MKTILLLVTYVITSSFGMVFIKSASKEFILNFENGAVKINIPFYFILGFIIYLVSFIIWIYIIGNNRLTYISPIAYGLLFIFISFLSIAFFGDQITRNLIIGVIFILLGVIFIIKS